MILNANKLSVSDLEAIDGRRVLSVSIENVIEKDKLNEIARMLDENSDIKIVVILDPAVTGSPDKLTNLQIVQALEKVTRLALLALSTHRLQNIDLLSGLTKLESFELKGFYRKDISLQPIRQATGLRELELEYGLSGRKQVEFVNNLGRLERLKVATLDLGQLTPNKHMIDLSVTNTLKQQHKLSALFPNLISFECYYARGIEAFDFLADLPVLQHLSIGYTKKLVKVPALANPLGLKSLCLVNTPEFADMEDILALHNLTLLQITEPVKIPAAAFERLQQLTKLSEVYVVFNNEEDDSKFAVLAEKRGWRLPPTH
jgi:hypothetical protein